MNIFGLVFDIEDVIIKFRGDDYEFKKIYTERLVYKLINFIIL